MKKLFTLLATFLAGAQLAIAQVGAVAPDFTVTDINGTTHNLYSILNSGKVVVLDCSATWCGPCWGYHTAQFLEDINATYGPTGTDQVRVIFYEADAATTAADLNGSGSNTQGDWVTGATYPLINEAPLQLSGSIFWPLGFPTINVISPTDKKIKGDLWDNWNPSNNAASLLEMYGVIDNYTLGVNEITTVEAGVFPNPSTGATTITVDMPTAGNLNVQVTNLTGQVVFTQVVSNTIGANSINLDLTTLAEGQYIVNLSNDDNFQAVTKVQIKK